MTNKPGNRLDFLKPGTFLQIRINALTFLLLLMISTFAVILSWQSNPEFYFDLKDPHNGAFVNLDATKVKYDELVINLPGIGKMGSNLYRLELMLRGAVLDRGGLQPELALKINNVVIESFRTTVQKNVKAYDIESGGGNLKISLKVKREKDLKLRYVKLYSLRIVPSYSDGVTFPPILLLIMFATSMIIVYYLPKLLGYTRETQWLVFICSVFLFGYLFSCQRMWMNVMMKPLFWILVFSLILINFLRKFLPRLFLKNNTEYNKSRSIRILATVILVFFIVKLLFVTYPSLISLDLSYHSRNLAKVMNGNLLLETVFPGNVYRIPYPPLFYLIVFPFAALFSNHILLFKVIFALSELLTSFLLAVLVHRLFGSVKAASWAFAVYNLLPYTYRVISAGFAAEMFSQTVLLLLFLFLLQEKKLNTKRSLILLGIVIAILMTHFGGVVKFFFVMLAMLPVYKLLKRSGINVLKVFLIVFIGVLICYLLFYVHYNEMFLDGLGKLVKMKSPIPETKQLSALGELKSQISYIGRYFFIPVIFGLFGLFLWARVEWEKNKLFKKAEGLKEYRPRDTSVIVWMLVSYLIVFFAGWLTPLKTRHLPLLAILVSIFAGYLFARLPVITRRWKLLLLPAAIIHLAYLGIIVYRLLFLFYRVNIN